MKTNCPCDAEKISELIRTGKNRPIDWMFTASKNWVVASSFTEFKEDFNKQENASMATVKKNSNSEMVEKALLGGTKIDLGNVQRGKYFRVVAEVWIDVESLADTLKAEGLAKDYDGEGARPEW